MVLVNMVLVNMGIKLLLSHTATGDFTSPPNHLRSRSILNLAPAAPRPAVPLRVHSRETV
eukprot:1189155-Prorocentrum_minimum.AAC.5